MTYHKLPYLTEAGFTPVPWAMIGNKCYTITTKPLYIIRDFSHLAEDIFEIVWETKTLRFRIYNRSTNIKKQELGLDFIKSLSI
jgi:hypothetical protein